MMECAKTWKREIIAFSLSFCSLYFVGLDTFRFVYCWCVWPLCAHGTYCACNASCTGGYVVPCIAQQRCVYVVQCVCVCVYVVQCVCVFVCVYTCTWVSAGPYLSHSSYAVCRFIRSKVVTYLVTLRTLITF